MKRLLLLITICIATASFGQVPSYVPTNGLVGWWPFNGNANDESGNGNNGTVNGATLTIDRFGNPNQAYDFDGSDWIDLVFNFPNSGDSPLTVSYWFRKNAPSNIEYAICFGNQVYGESFGTGIYGSGGYFTTFQGPQYDAVSGIPTAFNSWINIVCVYSSNGLVTIYEDGAQIHTQIVAPMNFLNGVGKIGGSIFNSFENWVGQLDDIGVWSRELDDCEIQDLYNAGINSVAGITQFGATLTADQNNAIYQWLDCDNNVLISGETNQSYTPTVTGNYAVEVTLNGCTSTSDCVLIDFTGLDELLNPIGKDLVRIINLLGQEVEYAPNTILIYQYSDGTTEKAFILD